mmetsp:Transcript_2077/g.5463  ORF Transcript_2077/g.5463 Transcript_2077/m.5463 type:complete len:177 (-) Transcript_2077:29-559(-)
MASLLRARFCAALVAGRCCTAAPLRGCGHLATADDTPFAWQRLHWVSSSTAAADLREFLDWSHREGGQSESLGRAWQEGELRLKSWEDLHSLWHLCSKERNLLLTEMAWRKVPKDLNEQILMNMPRGSDKEEDVHRLRYNEIQKSLKRIKKVMRERASRELNPVKRNQILTVINAK